MTQTNLPTDSAVSNAPGTGQPGSAGADPLLGLHKMSMTAGLGSTDYVAVNVTSVVSVLFALAGLLGILANLLLLIPVTGMILAIVALSQIRNSNGTQTGKGLAWIGLAISTLVIAGVLGNQGLQALRQRDDQKAIGALCGKLGQLVAGGQYDQAYDLFDDDFKARVSQDAFKVRLEMMQQDAVITPIVSIDTGGLMGFNQPEFGDMRAEAVMRTHYQNQRTGSYEIHFRRTAGRWLIDDIPDMFPPAKPPPGSPGAQGTPGS
jgi:hypothetical protein